MIFGKILYKDALVHSRSLVILIVFSSRQLAEHSPYYEMFKAENKEVLFAYDAADEVSLLALQQFRMKSVKSVENWTRSEAGGETQTASKKFMSLHILSLKGLLLD